MKKVGFITSPLSNANAVRGVGFYTRRLLPELKKQAVKFGFEIVENDMSAKIVHYPFFDLFRHTLPIFKSAKTVVTVHDVIPLEFPDHYPPGIKGWFNLQLQKLALSGVEGVITDSHASVQAIRKYLSVSHAKIKLIYLAADEKFKPKKVTKKYTLPKKFVLYVGDVNWNKNIPGLIKACDQINYPLVIVGKQATEIDKMDLSHPELKHLKDLDFKNVIRLGFVSDEELVDIYNLASVYCQPSFAEGFGLPVLEAMACGTPVACSRTHSLPEIAGPTASYFDPHNTSSMAKAIKSATPKGVMDQAKNFSWDKTATQTLQVYSEII